VSQHVAKDCPLTVTPRPEHRYSCLLGHIVSFEDRRSRHPYLPKDHRLDTPLLISEAARRSCEPQRWTPVLVRCPGRRLLLQNHQAMPGRSRESTRSDRVNSAAPSNDSPDLVSPAILKSPHPPMTAAGISFISL